MTEKKCMDCKHQYGIDDCRRCRDFDGFELRDELKAQPSAPKPKSPDELANEHWEYVSGVLELEYDAKR
jgi:hypothetical protein